MVSSVFAAGVPELGRGFRVLHESEVLMPEVASETCQHRDGSPCRCSSLCVESEEVREALGHQLRQHRALPNHLVEETLDAMCRADSWEEDLVGEVMAY